MTDAATPTAEDTQKAMEVGQAGAEAAAAAETPEAAPAAAKAAMRDKADQVGLPLSDADIERLADVFSDKTIDKIAARGGFDPPPEPVQPPETAPPAPGETASPQPVASEVQAPRKPSWAERHFGS